MNEKIEYVSSIQDFSLINTYVEKIKNDYVLSEPSDAFSFFALGLILGIQDDEIRDSITDNHYLKTTENLGGHDRGIDAVYIADDEGETIIHFFNFKYTTKFDKTKNNFPSSEIDKVINFLSSLFQKDYDIKNNVNPVLYSKMKEIWGIFDKKNPTFQIHLCSNCYEGLESGEKVRFEREVNKHSNIKIKYHLLHDFVKLVTLRDKKIVNGKIKAIDKNFFEKSDGDIRALIVDVDAKDLIRIVLDDEDIRNKAELTDYEQLKKFEILEDAFESNVRVYLKQRSKINKNIKGTALSSDSHRFFYYNNGITITCDRFTYMKTVRAPIIELENIQIVNGGQTVHALYDAFKENWENFEYIDILCRIYETQNTGLSTKIAEYTNNQNPVKNRDIQSIDFIQQKLEQEFLAKGLYYERKKNQYADQPKNLRLDAEKVGQVLMAFYNHMPAEALNKKSIIFAEKYDDIFNNSITSDKVLLAYKLFEKIEIEKNELKGRILQNNDRFESESFVLYSSYYILYIIGELCKMEKIETSNNNLEQIWALYPRSIKILKSITENELKNSKNSKDNFSYVSFFKSNKPKQLFKELQRKANLTVL